MSSRNVIRKETDLSIVEDNTWPAIAQVTGKANKTDTLYLCLLFLPVLFGHHLHHHHHHYCHQLSLLSSLSFTDSGLEVNLANSDVHDFCRPMPFWIKMPEV